MGVIDSMFRKLTERSAEKYELSEWPGVLAQFGAVVDNRFSAATETPGNANTGAHVIGIERWGQSRLRAFLGEPLAMDEYGGYRPPAETRVAEMTTLFRETRAETLAEANIPDTLTVPHNGMGGLTAHGWLAYLDSHATRESDRTKN